MSASERGPACPSSRASQSEQPCRTDPVRQSQAQWRRNASRLLSSQLVISALTQKYQSFLHRTSCSSTHPRSSSPLSIIHRHFPMPSRRLGGCASWGPPVHSPVCLPGTARMIMIVMQRPSLVEPPSTYRRTRRIGSQRPVRPIPSLLVYTSYPFLLPVQRSPTPSRAYSCPRT